MLYLYIYILMLWKIEEVGPLEAATLERNVAKGESDMAGKLIHYGNKTVLIREVLNVEKRYVFQDDILWVVEVEVQLVLSRQVKREKVNVL